LLYTRTAAVVINFLPQIVPFSPAASLLRHACHNYSSSLRDTLLEMFTLLRVYAHLIRIGPPSPFFESLVPISLLRPQAWLLFRFAPGFGARTEAVTHTSTTISLNSAGARDQHRCTPG